MCKKDVTVWTWETQHWRADPIVTLQNFQLYFFNRREQCWDLALNEQRLWELLPLNSASIRLQKKSPRFSCTGVPNVSQWDSSYTPVGAVVGAHITWRTSPASAEVVVSILCTRLSDQIFRRDGWCLWSSFKVTPFQPAVYFLRLSPGCRGN